MKGNNKWEKEEKYQTEEKENLYRNKESKKKNENFKLKEKAVKHQEQVGEGREWGRPSWFGHKCRWDSRRGGGLV